MREQVFRESGRTCGTTGVREGFEETLAPSECAAPPAHKVLKEQRKEQRSLSDVGNSLSLVHKGDLSRAEQDRIGSHRNIKGEMKINNESVFGT